MDVERTVLLDTLNSVMVGVVSKGSVEQSDCFVFQGQEVCTYNEEVACRAPIILEGVTGAVKAAPLLELLGKLSEPTIHVSVEKSELLIKGKKKQAGIVFESEIYLPLDSVEAPGEWMPLQDDFLDGLVKVADYVSTDASQFVLTCIHLTPEWMEATDSFQAVRYCVEVPVRSAGVLVKAAFVKPLVAAGVTQASETESWLHFRNPAGVIFSCRKYQSDYPELSTFLKFEGDALTLPEGLESALKKASIFSSDNPDTNVVQIQFKGNQLLLMGRGGYGWYREVKKVNYTGPDIRFVINPAIISSLIACTTECRIAAGLLTAKAGKLIYAICLGVDELE